MKNKLFNFLGLVIIFMFFALIDVKALPSSIGPISQVGSRVLDNCGKGEGCYGLALKVYGSTPVFCSSYHLQSPARSGAQCTLTNDWSEKVRYGVATIINEAKPNVNATAITNQYFAAEMAINRFLYNKGAGGTEIQGTILSNTYRSLYINYLDLANKAYDSYASASKVPITLSASSLTFTLSGTNYVSNSVTVSGVDSWNVTTNVGTVSKSGNSFKVTVPASSVTSSKSVTVTVSASKSFAQARNYDCGTYIDSEDYDGDGNTTEELEYQSLAPIALDSITKSSSKSLSGTITPKAKLIINKVDANNVHLSGATITVTGTKGYSKTFTTNGSPITIENLEFDTYTITETKAPSGYVLAASKKVTLSSTNLTSTVTLTDNKNKVSISKLDITGKNELPGATLVLKNSSGKTLYEWVSTTKPYTIEGLPAGTYYLQETIAPSGYVLNQEEIKFVIDSNTVTKTVTMTNKLNVVKISKLDIADSKLLPGATLEIQDEKGNIVKYCKDEKGNNIECKWISTDEAYEIEGMPNGKYYLVETLAPEGYVLNKEKVQFTIDGKKPIVQVQMKNKKNRVVINKIKAIDEELLPGATLEIQDEKGNIVKYCKDEKGNNIECKWVSTDEAYEIEGIPVGKYYLVETAAPEGYVLNKEKVEFTIKTTDDVVEVEMKNELEVEVPNTLSSRSALLLAIAMFDIAFGIGVITYVKKTKA